MFSVKHIECTGFESRWKVKKVSLVDSGQTTEYSSAEKGSNTTETTSIQVQTNTETYQGNTPSVDDEKLAEWLRKIYPSVKKELDDVTNSKAFRGYRPANPYSSLQDAYCKLLQNINVSAQVKNSEIGSLISTMSLNSSNNTLAVSCIHNHQSWCYHEGFVALYTFTNDDLLPNTPRLKLSAESCVMVLQFHPQHPAILAGGLFSGEIIIWNVQEGEQVLHKVSAHAEGVTQLSWVSDINSVKNFHLASSSVDCFLALWNFSLLDKYFVIKEKHQIKSPLLPKQSEEAEAAASPTKNVIRGILCFDFCTHTPEMFVVGAEGGLVVQCSLLGTRKVKGNQNDYPLLDSTMLYYEPHKGDVLSVAFSPNRKDMFMTSGSDNEIRFYLLGQEEPAQVIFLKKSLNFVTWIPYEEKIIAGCGTSGCVEIFDVVKGVSVEHPNKEKTPNEIFTNMQISRIKTNIVVVGTESGYLQNWRVPWGVFGNL